MLEEIYMNTLEWLTRKASDVAVSKRKLASQGNIDIFMITLSSITAKDLYKVMFIRTNRFVCFEHLDIGFCANQ